MGRRREQQINPPSPLFLPEKCTRILTPADHFTKVRGSRGAQKVISGPKSRNLPKFCTFSRKSYFSAKNRTFPPFSLQNAKNAQGSQGLLKPMPFIGILSSFPRKGQNVRNFAFLRRICGFCALFSFFRSKTVKIAKVRFERKVPLRTSHETYIYTFSFLAAKKINFFALFRLFHFWADLSEKSAPERKKSQISAFCSQKCKNAFFAFWTGKHLPEPSVYKAFYALAKTVIFCVFRIFYISLEIIFNLPRKFYEQRKFFAQKSRFPKTFIWALF